MDANGPGPVRYTVLKNNSPMPQCTNITTRGCDSTNLSYDGQTYSYSVVATNDNGKGVSSAQGPATQWRATGKPASWGAWSVVPTGNNNQARASFNVPPSRGAESLVRIYVDGTKVQQVAATGKTDQLFDVPNNLTSHSVMLEVCNEELECSQSAAQPVQTYGPLVTAHIHSITPTIDVTRISWTIEVDSNGDEATLTVTSDRGRNETFTVPVGVSTVTTQAVQLDYQQTENVTVTLSDGAPARGPVSATNSATTEPPPPPTVVPSARGRRATTTRPVGLPACDTGTCRRPDVHGRVLRLRAHRAVRTGSRTSRTALLLVQQTVLPRPLSTPTPDIDTQILLRQCRRERARSTAPTQFGQKPAPTFIW